MILMLLFVATTAFALPGDPPLHGGGCDPNTVIPLKSPDFPWAIPVVHKMIKEQAFKMFKAKIAPYIEIDPATGKRYTEEDTNLK